MTDKLRKQTHPIGALYQHDTLDPLEAELGARPQPDLRNVTVNDMWNRERAQNAQQALSRRRRRFWWRVGLIGGGLALAGLYALYALPAWLRLG